MVKQRLGSKPKLDWIGEGREGEGAILPEAQETTPDMTRPRKVRAERLSITADPELVAEFNKLCDMWRAAYPNTQKTDICNIMLSDFQARYGEKVRQRLQDMLSGKKTP